ncbi:MAG TPA: hypothetical protein VFI54_08120 [Solirubrobacteraceae bacterium]|nr:hypothetical protein [Solirubrobacteraceae bacterium]
MGFGDTFSGSCGGLLQVPPSASSFPFPCVVGGVVAVELESSLPRNAAENADVRVGHDSPEPVRNCFAAAAIADAFLPFWLKTSPGKREELGSLSAATILP